MDPKGSLDAFGPATDEEAHGVVEEAKRHLQTLTLSATAWGDRADQSHFAGLGELLRDRKFESVLLIYPLVGGKEDSKALGESPTASRLRLEEVDESMALRATWTLQ